MTITTSNYSKVVIIFKNYLHSKNIPFTLERNRIINGWIIWIDKQNNVGIRIDSLQIYIFHLDGGRLFNIESQDEILTENEVLAALNHLDLVLFTEFYQETIYKLGKPCLIRQFIFSNRNKIKISITTLNHWLVLVPLLKKSVITKKYKFSE